MEKSNVRKNPFGNPNVPYPQEQVRNIPPSTSHVEPPLRTNQNSSAMPPPKNAVQNRENEPQYQSRPAANTNMPAFTTNQTSETENILREFEILKNFNSSKGFIRPTTERIPANHQMFVDAAFPVGLIINPLSYYEPEVPLVSYGDNEIPRCISANCRAYINPFVNWVDGGDKWICNICKTLNNTENYYFNKLDSNGRRIDASQKPDLSFGSYDFLANKTKDRPPCVPTFIFLLDVSLAAIQNGFLSASIESIKDTINNDLIPNTDRVRIGILTYDFSVNFYIINSKFSQPQCLSITDDSIFLPTIIDNLVVNLNENKSQIINVLDLIQNSYTSSSCKDSNKIFHAINAGFLLCKENGGKLIAFNASVSITSLPRMKSPNANNIPKEDIFYSATDDKQLSNMGINMTNENISCDIFATSDNFVNLITLNQICDYTNGNIYFYKNFRLETNYKNIFNQIRRVLTRPIAWETVMRTRFSRGYKISSFVTPILISNGDLMIMSTLDSDQSYAVQIEAVHTLDNNPQSINTYNINADPFMHIQCAILYTHGDGSRRIRVHNLCLPVVNRLIDVFEGVDAEGLNVFLLKYIIDKIFKTKKITNSVLQLSAMTKSMISSALMTQHSLKKELPSNLIPFILYMLGALKHRVLCRDEVERKLDIDLSNYMRIKIQKLSVFDIQSFIYPRIYPVQTLLEDNQLGVHDEYGNCLLPDLLSANEKSFTPDGLYLIDNGFILIIYITQNINPVLLNCLFGVTELDKLNGPFLEDTVFTEPDGLKQRIMNIIDYIRSTKAIFQNLIFAFQGTEAERIIRECLIEDNYCPWHKFDYNSFYHSMIDTSGNLSRPGIR